MWGSIGCLYFLRKYRSLADLHNSGCLSLCITIQVWLAPKTPSFSPSLALKRLKAGWAPFYVGLMGIEWTKGHWVPRVSKSDHLDKTLWSCVTSYIPFPPQMRANRTVFHSFETSFTDSMPNFAKTLTLTKKKTLNSCRYYGLFSASQL